MIWFHGVLQGPVFSTLFTRTIGRKRLMDRIIHTASVSMLEYSYESKRIYVKLYCVFLILSTSHDLRETHFNAFINSA